MAPSLTDVEKRALANCQSRTRPEVDTSSPQHLATPALIRRSFDEIRDDEVRLIAGYHVDGNGISLPKRREIFAAS